MQHTYTSTYRRERDRQTERNREGNQCDKMLTNDEDYIGILVIMILTIVFLSIFL